VLTVNPPDKWEELVGMVGNCGENSRAHDLSRGIPKVPLDSDAGRVRTNARERAWAREGVPSETPSQAAEEQGQAQHQNKCS
jgi:hypothetical protein